MFVFDVKQQGFDKVSRALRELPPKLQTQALKPALKQGALLIKKKAQAKVRKRTGLLRKHIQVVMLRPAKGKLTALIGIPRKTKIMSELAKKGKKPFYWLFLERGTKKMRPFPYLRPANVESSDEIHALIDHSTKTFMKTYFRKGGAA